MKFSKEQLLDVLNSIRPALSKISFNPELQNFLFTGDTICAHDERQALVVTFKTEMECTVSGETLLSYINACSGEEIELELTGTHIVVTSGGSTAKIKIGDVEKYPPIPGFDPDLGSFSFTFTEELISAMKKCRHTISREETYHTLTYLMIQGSDVFSGTDNHLSWARLKGDKYPEGLFLMEEAVDILISMDEDAVGEIQGNQLFVTKDDLHYVLLLPIDLDLMDIKAQFAQYKISSVYKVPKGMSGLLVRAAIFAGSKWNSTIVLGMKSPTELEVFASSDGLGTFHEFMSVELVGEVSSDEFIEFKTKLNPRDLLVAISAADRFGVKLDVGHGAVQFINEDGDFQQLISIRG